MKNFFTSESVTEGHPDKLCDLISDSILDACLAQDKHSRVACETVAGKGLILVTGEITSNAKINIEQIVRDIHYLLKKEQIDRGSRLFNEYLTEKSLNELLTLEEDYEQRLKKYL